MVLVDLLVVRVRERNMHVSSPTDTSCAVRTGCIGGNRVEDAGRSNESERAQKYVTWMGVCSMDLVV